MKWSGIFGAQIKNLESGSLLTLPIASVTDYILTI